MSQIIVERLKSTQTSGYSVTLSPELDHFIKILTKYLELSLSEREKESMTWKFPSDRTTEEPNL